MNEREIFESALDRLPADRALFLDKACADDASLRQRVDALLELHEGANQFLEQPAYEVDFAKSNRPVTEGPGTVIGPYKLLQKIGEGGFGVVYMAQQERPVRRIVALKIIKPGMDTAQVIARFESERQALALMDHPNIARVLDAGATDSGRPYFVMELVKGVPITEFCDRNHMPSDGRLRLMMTVCQAIQHAHHKGVIHRDIKPSNVMVTLHDGVPVVKVIDFGVAKATVQKLTERTLFTAYGQMIGTPVYMSPEQAEMSGLDIDTRSDVYSLGVLLYELLTGTTPLENKQLRAAGYAEMQRLIREQEAPRPSNRLSSLKGEATVLAGNRGTEVSRLVRLLAGDLDWIVMKALEKDRNRRYGTPGNFAEDIERYLTGEAILARPPSTSYKFRKFAQRNRAAFVTAGALLSIVLLGSVLSLWQTARANRARQQAIIAEKQARDAEAQALQDRADALAQRKIAEEREAEARSNEQKSHAAELAAKESEATTKAVMDFVKSNIFAAARPPLTKAGLGREVTLRQALDAAEPKIASAFARQPRVEARLRAVLGATYSDLDERQLAMIQLERALVLAREHYGPDDELTATVEKNLAWNHLSAGRSEEAFRLLEQSLARRRQTLGNEHPTTLEHLGNLADIYVQGGRNQDAKSLYEELLRIRSKHDFSSRDVVHVRRLANLYNDVDRTDEAVRLVESVLPRMTSELGPDNFHILELNHSLAIYLLKLDRNLESVAIMEPTYQRVVRARGTTHAMTQRMMRTLANGLSTVGRSEDLAKILEASLPDLRRELGPTNAYVTGHVINLSVAYLSSGRYRDACTLLEETIGAIPERERTADGNLDLMLNNLAVSYMSLDDLPNTLRIMLEIEHYNRARHPPESLILAGVLVVPAINLIAIDQFVEAERLLREIYSIRKSKEPGGVRTILAKALLGQALAEQKRFVEAEQLLVSGYHELRARRSELMSSVAKEVLEGSGRALAVFYDRIGRTDDAKQVCREGIACRDELNSTGPNDFVTDACWHSVNSALLKSDPNENDNPLATMEADHAMALLKRAVKAGFKDVSILKMDHHLDALRDREDFQQLLDELKPKESSPK